MGISDRHYSRADSGTGVAGLNRMRGWSFNTWLIAVNVAVFVAAAFFPALALQQIGHFSTARGFFGLEVWRFLSFQFLHANVMHLFFNMFGLFLFGQMVENRLGFRRYAAFYLVCGVFGALMYLLLNLAGTVFNVSLPGVLMTDPRTPLVGASAGVFGVLMAAAYYHPNAPMQFLLIPVSFRLKWLVLVYVGLALLNLLTAGKNAGGDAAHIGGALAGWYFIRHPHLLHDFFDVFGRTPPDRKAKTSRWPLRGGKAAAPDDAEVDRLLAKVGTQGIGSLTDREKETLRRATASRGPGANG